MLGLHVCSAMPGVYDAHSELYFLGNLHSHPMILLTHGVFSELCSLATVEETGTSLSDIVACESNIGPRIQDGV